MFRFAKNIKYIAVPMLSVAIPVVGVTAYGGKIGYAGWPGALCETVWPFDTRGMPTHIRLSSSPQTQLSLAGVGMRRKNFYVMEVDVYLCGLALNDESLERARRWKAHGSTESLPEILLAPSRLNKLKSNGPRVSVTLRFVRTVGKDKVVEAFNDAFKGLPEEEVAAFKTGLSASVGETVKEGEEIGFFWMNSGLQFTKNGVPGELVQSNALAKRLLSVYLDPAMTVSKELVESVDKNVDTIMRH